jgi:hypothetical protein
MNDVIYQKLIGIAQAGKLISYSELACVPGLDMGRKEEMEELGRALDEIAIHEIAAGRPLLPIVVIRDDTKMPGRGLFKFARARGLLKIPDDLAFFSTELKRVYEVWKPK